MIAPLGRCDTDAVFLVCRGLVTDFPVHAGPEDLLQAAGKLRTPYAIN